MRVSPVWVIFWAILGAIVGYFIVFYYFLSIAPTGESPMMFYGAIIGCNLGVPIGALIAGAVAFFVGSKFEVDESEDFIQSDGSQKDDELI